ncbi:MAG TPA: NTP transferase domain-containing protein [Abditibacteriaceae bacterium]|nr:NTP transferase domain-containing protein [Abditibacteriaceae bacterium]
MNALILCAGSARRFFPEGATHPKCLLSLSDDETLLDRLLRQTRALEYDAVLGTGCGHELVVSHLQQRNFHGVHCVFNPDYATTNSIVTLWQARDWIRDDTLVINGDVVLPDDALKLFDDVPSPQLLTKHQPFDDDSYRVLFDEQMKIVRMGKDLEDEASPFCAAFTGVSRVGDARRFLREIEKLLHLEVRQTWPTTAYRNLIGEVPVRAVDIGQRLFFDIDTPNEYSMARQALREIDQTMSLPNEPEA